MHLFIGILCWCWCGWLVGVFVTIKEWFLWDDYCITDYSVLFGPLSIVAVISFRIRAWRKNNE